MIRTTFDKIKLSETTKFIVDNRGKTAPTEETGIALIATNCITNGSLYPAYDNVRYVSQETYDTWFRAHPEPGDIIVTNKGSQNGAICLVPEPVDFVIAQDMMALRANEEVIDPLYLFAALRSPMAQWQINSLDVSGVIPHFKKSDFDKLYLPYPDMPTQKAIGKIYFDFCDKIELNRRMNATLESLARAIFKSWFVDFDPVKINAGQMPASSQALATHDPKVLDLFPSTFQDSGVPEGWEQTTLGDEVDFQTGCAFKSKFFTNEPPGTRLARGMNVKEGVFFWGNQTRYWPEVTEDVQQYLLEVGDVLIGMDGSKVGKNWVRVREVDLPCLLVQRVARLRAAQSVGENFLWILCGSETFRRYVDSVKTGTSIPHISGGQIKSLPFLRPPKGDDRVFHEFESIVGAFANQHDKNAAESASLRETRDSLLPRLLSGELSVDALAEETHA